MNDKAYNAQNEKRHIPLIVVTTVFSVIYLVWRALFTIPFEYGAVSAISGISLLIVEVLGLVESSIHHYNLCDVLKPEVPVIQNHEFPHVDIFISTYNEPEEVLIKTINGCKHMKYPDLNRVHIYMCDDGHRANMKILAAKLGVNYLDRDNHDGAKAGNLNHALSKTTSPYIVTFDADMIPRSNFLLRTIPYFVDAEKHGKHIGFVQTPQAFYNPDLFQYYLYSEERIPNEQDYFYRDIQVSRNKSNCVIYGGSNTVISRRALEDIGGFYTETITEDYATGMLIQKKGYTCIATDEVLASGLSATDLKSLINQRIRWARGVITTNRKMHTMTSRDLSFAQKLNYWASVWYWYAPLKRLIYYMCPILYGAFGYMVIKCTLWQILLFWLPMYITNNMSLRIMSHNLRTAKWTGIYETILFPFLLIPVLMETVGIKMTKFKVTKKGAVESEAGKNTIYMIPFALLIILSGIGIYNCISQIFESNDLGPSVVLFWLIINLYTLVMALFFVMGRNYIRRYDRVETRIDAILYTRFGKYECVTGDISDDGLSIIYHRPINIDDKKPVGIDLKTDDYKCRLTCRLIYSDDPDNLDERGYKYAFKIIDYMNTYYEYLQMIYDRVPSLPQHLDDRTGSFDDLKINVLKRTVRPVYQKRTTPRLAIEPVVIDREGEKHRVVDFNYKFITLRGSTYPKSKEILAIDPDEGIFLICERIKEIGRYNDGLYRVVNYYDIAEDRRKNRALEKWVERELIYTTQDDKPETVKRKKKQLPGNGLDEMKYIK